MQEKKIGNIGQVQACTHCSPMCTHAHGSSQYKFLETLVKKHIFVPHIKVIKGLPLFLNHLSLRSLDYPKKASSVSEIPSFIQNQEQVSLSV